VLTWKVRLARPPRRGLGLALGSSRDNRANVAVLAVPSLPPAVVVPRCLIELVVALLLALVALVRVVGAVVVHPPRGCARHDHGVLQDDPFGKKSALGLGDGSLALQVVAGLRRLGRLAPVVRATITRIVTIALLSFLRRLGRLGRRRRALCHQTHVLCCSIEPTHVKATPQWWHHYGCIAQNTHGKVVLFCCVPFFLALFATIRSIRDGGLRSGWLRVAVEVSGRHLIGLNRIVVERLRHVPETAIVRWSANDGVFMRD
jgi:hypothetical protein